MEKSILFLLFSFFLLFSCQKESNKLVIEGELSSLTTPYVISSSRVSDTIRVDTIFVNDKGKFSYTQNIDTTTIFTFYFNDFNSSTVVFADKGIKKIKMKGDAQLSDLIEIKGGEINEDLTSFKKDNEVLLKQRSLLMAIMDSDNDSIADSGSIIKEKEEVATLNSINHKLSQNVEEFISAHPSKLSSVILINEFFKNNENPETLDRILGYLKDDALYSSLTYQLKSYNNKLKLSAEGAVMPYFKLKVGKDKFLKSSDFRDKFLLLSFLSCSQDKSKEDIEILQDTYSTLDTTKVQFLSIFIDSDSIPMENLSLDSIPWKTFVENKSWGAEIVDAYNITYVPLNILIDPKGKIITRNIPISDVKSLIDTKTKDTKK